MRCKNCGYDNNENLYICQNCGSPLYDEDELEEVNAQENTDATKVFNTVGNDVPDNSNDPMRNSHERRLAKEAEKKKQQQRTAIIIILVVILIAVIIGVVTAIAKSDDKSSTTTDNISSSDEYSEAVSNITTSVQTTSSTTAENTTEETTAETTESETTTTTTKPVTYKLSLSSNDGGETEGSGNYELGENVTIIARADDGYEFVGWFKGSTMISSSTMYTVTVTESTNLKAVFTPIQTEPEDTVDILDGEND